MPKIQTVTTNFTAGEFSPRLAGRVDLQQFNASAEKLENVVVLRQGGATMRPSMDYKGEIKSSSQTARIIPFVYSRSDAYLIELGNLYARFWKNGAPVETSPGVPYEIVTPWTQAQLAALDFTQRADTLIVCHPDVATQRLLRFSDTLWTCDAVPFDPPAVYEGGHRSATVDLTISNVAVGTGRTVTASGAFFLASDQGRVLSWGPGLATITGITSPTVVTARVDRAFSVAAIAGPGWLLEGSPETSVTPSQDEPVGATGTATLGADGWRTDDVGKIIELNGGLVQIESLDGVSPTTIANYRILRVLAAAVLVNRRAWQLLGPVWNEYDGYPASCTTHQQRLWLGGTARFPQTKWGSRSGLFFDFTPGTNDDSAVYKTFDSDDVNLMQYLVSSTELLAMTYGGEFRCQGGVEKPITQLNDQIKMLSRWGAELVRPEQAGEDVIYVQRGGKAIRAIRKNELDVLANQDVSVFSEHLFRDGVRSMSWEQTPEQVMWIATSAGKLVPFTYSSEQRTFCFASGNASGFVEWLATIPEGSIDATYALVRRTVNGATKRYIERLNWQVNPGQDSRVEVTLGAPALVFPGFDHLEGETVAVLADGSYQGNLVVTGGDITLQRAATTVSAGLPYTGRIRLQAPEVGTGTGTSQGQTQSTHRVLVRFLETIGCKVNGDEVGFRQFGAGILDQTPDPFTGFKDITSLGWDRENPLEITQEQPYPWTVLGVVRDFTVNQG
jgi:hypothetical protein